jgi:hypothetical protein
MDCLFQDDILIFRDDLKYTLDETIEILKNVCDVDKIKHVYENNRIRLINQNSILIH